MPLIFNQKLAKTCCGCLAGFVLLLAGCASQPPDLYNWGHYQDEVHAYFLDQGADAATQLATLTSDLEKIKSSGSKIPPGFHAHLGLLYLKLGQLAQMQREFSIEKNLYAESSAYIDFLSKNSKTAPIKSPAISAQEPLPK